MSHSVVQNESNRSVSQESDWAESEWDFVTAEGAIDGNSPLHCPLGVDSSVVAPSPSVSAVEERIPDASQGKETVSSAPKANSVSSKARCETDCEDRCSWPSPEMELDCLRNEYTRQLHYIRLLEYYLREETAAKSMLSSIVNYQKDLIRATQKRLGAASAREGTLRGKLWRSQALNTELSSRLEEQLFQASASTGAGNHAC